MTPALPCEAPDPSAMPALHALLKEVEADTATVDNHLVDVGFTMKAHDRNADRAPRLAAMLRVAVDALDRLDDTGGSMWSMPSTEVAVAALARIERIAAGEP